MYKYYSWGDGIKCRFSRQNMYMRDGKKNVIWLKRWFSDNFISELYGMATIFYCIRCKTIYFRIHNVSDNVFESLKIAPACLFPPYYTHTHIVLRSENWLPFRCLRFIDAAYTACIYILNLYINIYRMMKGVREREHILWFIKPVSIIILTVSAHYTHTNTRI
jgi:hypothetical protein